MIHGLVGSAVIDTDLIEIPNQFEGGGDCLCFDGGGVTVQKRTWANLVERISFLSLSLSLSFDQFFLQGRIVI